MLATKLIPTVVGLFAVSLGVKADAITDLTYQGALMTGTYTYLPTGFVCPSILYNGDSCPGPFPRAEFSGAFTANITIDGTIGENAEIISYNLTAPGYAPNFAMPHPLLSVDNSGRFCGGDYGCITITTANGSITGATFNFDNGIYHSSPYDAIIGPYGDSFDYVNYILQVGRGCNGSDLTQTYAQGTISPCTITASNTTAGHWTVSTAAVPGPASVWLMLSGLGGLSVMVRRRDAV